MSLLQARLALLADRSLELLKAARSESELALEGGDDLGLGWVGLVGGVEVSDHLLEAVEAGSHVRDL